MIQADELYYGAWFWQKEWMTVQFLIRSFSPSIFLCMILLELFSRQNEVREIWIRTCKLRNRWTNLVILWNSLIKLLLWITCAFELFISYFLVRFVSIQCGLSDCMLHKIWLERVAWCFIASDNRFYQVHNSALNVCPDTRAVCKYAAKKLHALLSSDEDLICLALK